MLFSSKQVLEEAQNRSIIPLLELLKFTSLTKNLVSSVYPHFALCLKSYTLPHISHLIEIWLQAVFFLIFSIPNPLWKKKSHHCWPPCWLARFLPGTSFKLTRCLQLLYMVGESLLMLKMRGSGLPRSFSQESKPKPYFRFRDSCLFLSLGVGVWMTLVGVWTQTFIRMVHFEIRK